MRRGLVRGDLGRWAGLAAAAGVCLVLVRFPPAEYGFYPVCPFHAWTGLLCPGCGGTRAVAALVRGQWAEAWRWNALVVSLVPAGVGYGAAAWVRERWAAVPRGVWVAVGVAAGAFFVFRNVG